MAACRGILARRASLNDAERLTATWWALAAVLAAVRWFQLQTAGRDGDWMLPWWPIAIYQDALFVLALGVMGHFIITRVANARARLVIRILIIGITLVAAWFTAVSAEVSRLLNTPLTFRLVALSDSFRGIATSLEATLTTDCLVRLASAPLAVIVIALVVIRFTPRLVLASCRAASRWRWRVAALVYFAAAHTIALAAELDPLYCANPHATMIRSLWDLDDPFVAGEFSEEHAGDFKLPAAQPSDRHGQLAGSNIIMIVLESVGARWLSHYGSQYATSPELTRLARRGITFDRMYASQPYTSNTMAGMYCSLYPWHGWRSLPRRAPELQVPGVGDVLQSHGYRTAMLHTGDMQFDNEKWFLRAHGFEEVHDVWSLHSLLKPDGHSDADVPPETPGVHRHLPDHLLLPAATRWIDAEPSRPFFLTLWNIQTHHPYFAEPSNEQFVDDDAEFNRYLNAIRVADRLIADLMRELSARGLADNTLIVITGDHGESFGQHRYRTHSQTLYEESMHIPFVMLSPRLGSGERLRTLGQQIDVAPTLLDLLGIEQPESWQGRSLFAPDRTDRVYMFTGFYHYLFAVIEGNHKYIYNATTGERQMFNLANDPTEQVNQFDRPGERARAEILHKRLASWVHFQNTYLKRFVPAP